MRRIGDKVKVRFYEAPMPPVRLEPYSDTNKEFEAREVTRLAEVLSVLSNGAVCVRFQDGHHMVAREDQIIEEG